MKKAELVFVPGPGRGHLVSALEFATQLLNRDDRFSVTVLIIKSPFEILYADSTFGTSAPLPQSLLTSHVHNLQLINVPTPKRLPSPELFSQSIHIYISEYIESHKPHVKEIIADLFPETITGLSGISGLVVDLFCTAMIGIADEIGVPSYVFFTSGAGFLRFLLYTGDRGGEAFDESVPEYVVPSYLNPVPTRVLPSFAFNRQGGYGSMAYQARKFKKTKGIIVNTVLELESHAVGSCSSGGIPPVYTVGPLLDLNGKHNLPSDRSHDGDEKIIRWLDRQPPKSVAFLCFGSAGTFDVTQIREIAIGLEQSGQRFLWSIRKTPPQGKIEDDEDPDESLPPGFLERTKDVGLICGWAPQVKVLAHRAIGGFVSHCGWNSILESLWFGVPIATWPMYAEQQLNAYHMVRDLASAVELVLDYRMDGDDVVVMANEIARAVGCVMDGDSEVRKRVEEMSGTCRRAVVDGGSSRVSFGRLIEDMLSNAA